MVRPYGGYGGDEGQGMMGSLNVVMASGLFDIKGGCSLEPQWEIGCPLFDEVKITLSEEYYSGKTLTLVSPHASRHDKFVQHADWNGLPLESLFVSHEQLVAGGRLELKISSS